MTRRVLLLVVGLLFMLAVTTPMHHPHKAVAGPGDKISGALAEYLAVLQSPIGKNALTSAGGDTNAMLSSDAGSLQLDQAGSVIVEIRVTDSSPATVNALVAAGAHFNSPTWIGQGVTAGWVTALVSPANLNAIAALPQVLSISAAPKPGINRTDSPLLSAAAPPAFACGTPSGNAISEGNVQLNANAARTTYGVDGTGVLVGVQSDSYNAWDGTAGFGATPATSVATDIAADDLPGPGNPCGHTTANNILADCPAASGCLDEGRAMMQIVHDIAPGSTMAFAHPVSSTDFANRLTAMAALPGGKVFSDDLTFFDEPSYQEAPIGVAAGAATNTLSFTAAGNSRGTAGGVNWNGYETQAYRPTTCPGVIPAGHADCMNFGSAGSPDPTYGLTVTAGQSFQVIVQWAEPWLGVTDDFDIYLTNNAGTLAPGCTGILNNLTAQKPYDWFGCTPGGTDRAMVIARKTGSIGAPRMKMVFWRTSTISAVELASSLQPGDTEGNQIFAHQCSQNFVSVGATPATGGGAGTALESYSSFGPCTYLFGPVNGITPALPLGSPVTISKPDVVATDCNLTTFFLGSTPYRFCGTSAASPHAAAVAALLNEFQPLTVAQVKNAILSTATFMAGGPNQVGAGLVNALAALGSVAPVVGNPTVTTPTKTAITDTSATLGGNVTSDGGAAVTERGVVISLTSANANPLIGGAGVTKIIAGSAGTGVFTVPATGLTAASGYSYKAYATNSTGTGYTSVDTFTTLGPPTVISPTKTAITHNSATLGGNVSSDGGTAVTERGVVLSLTSANANPLIGGAGVTKLIAGAAGTGVFTVPATGLTPTSGYSYKAYAINSIGTSYTTVDTFTTLAPPVVPPTVTSPTKTSITQTGATLGGNVTVDGGAAVTERGVVFSPTATNSNPLIGGAGVVKVAAGSAGLGVFTVPVTGLLPNTAYTYKAYGMNTAGPGYSTADTFTTLPLIAPTIAKAFAAPAISVGGKTVLSFTLSNPNPVPLTGVAFTDNLPGIGSPGGGIVLATPPNPSSPAPCGGTLTALAGASTLSLANGTLPAGGNCTFSVEVFGFRPGAVNNTTSGVSSNEAPTGTGASALLTVNPPLGKGLTEVIPSIQAPVLTKNFGANATPFLPLNTPTSLTFTIKNNNTLFALSGMGFTDNLPGGMVISTPNALVNTCGGTVTAVPGTSTITVAGAMLASSPATTSCTITVNVQGATAGSFINNTTPITSVEGGAGNAASAPITVGQVLKKGI